MFPCFQPEKDTRGGDSKCYGIFTFSNVNRAKKLHIYLSGVKIAARSTTGSWRREIVRDLPCYQFEGKDRRQSCEYTWPYQRKVCYLSMVLRGTQRQDYNASLKANLPLWLSNIVFQTFHFHQTSRTMGSKGLIVL